MVLMFNLCRAAPGAHLLRRRAKV